MWYYKQVAGNGWQNKNARVVELVDSLDSGSSVHSERAGSTPASRTKDLERILRSRSFYNVLFRSVWTIKMCAKYAVIGGS